MESVIKVDKDVQDGTPCFAGTRVPVLSLFDHLEGVYTIDYFMSQFPSVVREQVLALLRALYRTGRFSDQSLAAEAASPVM